MGNSETVKKVHPYHPGKSWVCAECERAKTFDEGPAAYRSSRDEESERVVNEGLCRECVYQPMSTEGCSIPGWRLVEIRDRIMAGENPNVRATEVIELTRIAIKVSATAN